MGNPRAEGFLTSRTPFGMTGFGVLVGVCHDPSTPAKRTGRINHAARPDAPEGGAKEKSGRSGRDDNRG